MKQMSYKAWGNIEEKMRLWYLLHEVLTETTSAQPIVSLYPQPNFMLYPWGIDRNRFMLVSLIVTMCGLMLKHLLTSILPFMLFWEFQMLIQTTAILDLRNILIIYGWKAKITLLKMWVVLMTFSMIS